MKSRFLKVVIFMSIALNVIVSFPAVVILLKSSVIQNDLYQHLAPRFGTPRIAFIGDSITEEGRMWGLRIGEYNFDVWNFGHGGLTTRQLQHYAKKVANYKSKYAFVMAGINDLDAEIFSASSSFNDYKVLIETLVEAGTKPIVQLTLYRERETNPEFIDELNSLLRKYTLERELPIIDLNPLLCPEKSLLPIYSKDGVHLTPAAYRVWAKEVRRILNELGEKES